ncbi:MAG: IPT/TIG domain-containing protein [Deltaproteobacteria bacterium]|nr:IPT/TIG domain-containing protein [Deltaproteobacteria bacterium]
MDAYGRAYISTIIAIAFSLFLTFGCGNAPSVEFDESVPAQLSPIVTRVAPVAGRAGDTITIFGFGFSAEAQQNIVVVGGSTAIATAYALVDPPAAGELERLTFVVPSGAAVGATTIACNVFEQASNGDVAFTVNP